MKKIGLFVLSMIFAFILVELFLQLVIGFPTFGVKARLTGIRGSSSGTQSIFKPYSKYFTVEGGLRIYQRNNLGFTGLDVDTSGGKKYIAILGDSFIEAYQVPPESTAVGILKVELSKVRSDYEPINLGVSGHDPMDLLYRVSYFNLIYDFKKVILVISHDPTEWLKRQAQTEYTPRKVEPNNSLLESVSIVLMNSSVLFDLLAKNIGKNFILKEKGLVAPTKSSRSSRQNIKADDRLLEEVLEDYLKIFGHRLMVLNIGENEDESVPISARALLDSNRIEYLWRPLVLEKNRIDGNGHLNIEGNRKLGKIIFGFIR